MTNQSQLPQNLPIMGNDAQDKMLNHLQRFNTLFTHDDINQARNFPYISEYEAVLHYQRGALRPFVDIKVYADIGVGWDFNPVGFDDPEDGDTAKQMVENWMQSISFNQTMTNFAKWYEILGRACLITTKDALGNYYQNPIVGVTGVDAINPMTLTYESIQNVMSDPTGTAEYVQNTAITSQTSTPQFTQDRV